MLRSVVLVDGAALTPATKLMYAAMNAMIATRLSAVGMAYRRSVCIGDLDFSSSSRYSMGCMSLGLGLCSDILAKR